MINYCEEGLSRRVNTSLLIEVSSSSGHKDKKSLKTILIYLVLLNFLIFKFEIILVSPDHSLQ